MYELRNHVESSARQILQDYLRQASIPCACELCQADILAMTLNRLPARYYVSLRGEIMTSFESQGAPDQAKIMAEIIRACKLVAKHPSHN